MNRVSSMPASSNPLPADKLTKRLRLRVLQMIHRAQSSHIGSNFSMIELLAVLYSNVLRYRATEPKWADRDRLIISKGHACASVYAVLAEFGFFPEFWLDDFYQDGSRLAGHVTSFGVPGIELSTGSLGHGLPVACGFALAAKWDERPHRVFAILSDGECDEGSNWEAFLFAPHHKLDNLVAIIDYNKIQSLTYCRETLNLEPLTDKFRAFGWAVREVDGHDPAALIDVLSGLPFEAGKPSCLIAHTVKGKGVSFMEDDILWHYRCPDPQEMERAVNELKRAEVTR